MVDFDDNIQGNISFYNNNTAQFRLLWTIKEYEKVRESIKHPNSIRTKLPVNVLPGKFTCEIELHPNGDERVTDSDFASVYIHACNKEKLNSVWVSFKISLLDGTSKEQYVDVGGSLEFKKPKEGWGSTKYFPVNVSEDEATILFPNGCLQILVQGIVWSEEPVDKSKEISHFNDCSITSSVTLYQSDKYSDATLSVGEGKFQVHKNILSAKSSVFQELFENSSQNIIVIPDIKEEVLREVVNYLYSDTVSSAIDTMLPEVLVAAKKYELQYLAEICQVKMLGNLGVNNCLEYLEVSDSCGASQLKEKTLEYITQNRKLVFANEEFKTFNSKPKDLLWELLKRCMNLD